MVARLPNDTLAGECGPGKEPVTSKYRDYQTYIQILGSLWRGCRLRVPSLGRKLLEARQGLSHGFLAKKLLQVDMLPPTSFDMYGKSDASFRRSFSIIHIVHR